MYPVSNAFRVALQKSHRIATRVDIVSDISLTTLTSALGGYITVDRNAEFRRMAYFTLTDPEGALVPVINDVASALSIYGNEFIPYRGVSFPDGTEELVPLGVYGLAEVDITDSGQGQLLRVTGMDRSRRVALAKLTEPYQIAAGTNVGLAIRALIEPRLLGFPVNYYFDSVSAVTPSMVFDVAQDVWKICVKLAESVGCEVYFDAVGDCILKQIQSASSTATSDWDYVEGDASTILSLQRYIKDEHIFNWYVVTGEGTGLTEPVRGEAKDTNSASPTNVFGRFGARPRFIQSSKVTSSAQAATMAQGMLDLTLGRTELVQFTALANPAHDIADLLWMKRLRSKVDDMYVLDQLTVPLDAQSPVNGLARKLPPI